MVWQTLFSGKKRRDFKNVCCWNFYPACKAIMSYLQPTTLAFSEGSKLSNTDDANIRKGHLRNMRIRRAQISMRMRTVRSELPAIWSRFSVVEKFYISEDSVNGHERPRVRQREWAGWPWPSLPATLFQHSSKATVVIRSSKDSTNILQKRL